MNYNFIWFLNRKKNNLKNTFFLFIVAVTLVITACSKDDVADLAIQSHEDNRMIDTIHAMNMNNDPEMTFHAWW